MREGGGGIEHGRGRGRERESGDGSLGWEGEGKEEGFMSDGPSTVQDEDSKMGRRIWGSSRRRVEDHRLWQEVGARTGMQ